LLNWRDNLRLHAREVRQRATGLHCALQTALRSPATAFAQHISLRYQSRATALPRLAQVLPVLRPSLIAQHQRFSINLAPRLSLNLRRVETMLRSHTPAQGGGDEADRRRGRVRHAEQLVPRIFARAEREEAQPAPNGQTTQRVLARPSATQTEIANGPTMERAQYVAPAAMIERNAAASPQNLEPAPLDVQRLTNEVIQVLDRRIMAERERLGRI
jgi:hypothetical protein